MRRGSGMAVAVDVINTWDELHDEPGLIGVEDVQGTQLIG
jgi:hypothetical protein